MYAKKQNSEPFKQSVMKTLLVPTDFSDISENAVNYAAELSKFLDARLVLLNTYSLPMPLVETPVANIQFEEINRANKEQLKALDKRLKAGGDDLRTELITAIGFSIEEILLYSETTKADIVVLGVPGAKSSSTDGSNTISVAQESKCPVLMVPEGVKFKKPARIALACDYSSIVPDDVVQKFIDFVNVFNAKVLVFDVLKKAELVTYEKAMVEENLEESLHDIEHTLHFPTGDNLVEEINAFVDRHLVDLLVMMPHKYNFLQGLFHRSNTKQMALHSHIPLLAIHE